MMSDDKLILRFETKLVILRREALGFAERRAPKNLDGYRFFAEPALERSEGLRMT
ncbi:MAG: hypothetical protein Q7S07_05895 [Candidatus Omnitrophota bacterium]|nr:hypothetical protein [Candidatus Omnitrophota bacterium]